MRKKVFDLLSKIEPAEPDFVRGICAGLKDDRAYEIMIHFLENNPGATSSDVHEKLSEIRGIPSWNTELGRFVLPDE